MRPFSSTSLPSASPPLLPVSTSRPFVRLSTQARPQVPLTAIFHPDPQFPLEFTHTHTASPARPHLSSLNRVPVPLWAPLVVPMVKSRPAVQETRVQPLGRKDPLEGGTARTPGTEEPGGLSL